MIKFIESKRLDYFLFPALILTKLISLLDIPFKQIPLAIIFLIYFILYTIRIFTAFHNWKISKGVSFINAYLSFQILNSLMAIAYVFLNWPGKFIITYNAIMSPQYFIAIIGFVLIISFNSTNWALYWSYLKFNILKAALGIAICLIMFYTLDMPSKLDPYPPSKRLISLP
ncbi:MAG: hypothetical protein J7604_23110 [Sporocytophaga sp.]|uniref:hypothetical protein n=1 Tax=Sporocytophaga sp. TaxID=2231183 RepID=UPI001B0A7B41|nr:hypothetical protein [Sporocytophaga sp.]MBO9703122.1 hypothetical protein [Sporocytophaga sp.]